MTEPFFIPLGSEQYLNSRLREMFIVKNFLNKFNQKHFMQNTLIEVTADLLMLCTGIGIGHFFKTIFL